MARYTTTIASPWSAQEAFEYMADLRNFAQWDPGVKASKLTTGTEPGVGAEYKVTVGLADLTYVTKEYDVPTRTVAEATTTTLRSYDIIEVTETKDGCEVFYDARLTLNGVFGLFGLADPVLGLAFGRIGDKAAAGMAKALDGKKIR